MKNMLSRSLAIVCALALGLSLASAQKSYTLVYKFVPGKTYQYKSVSDGTVIQEMMGQEMKIENGSDVTVSIETESVDPDGVMTLVTKLVEGTTRVKNPMQDTTMVLTDMVGKRIKLHVKKDGTVVSREIVDTVDTQSAARGGGQREAVRFHILPAKAVKEGDTWTSTFTDTVNNMGGKIVNTVNSNYTFAGMESRDGASLLKIAYTGTIAVEGTGNMQGMDLYIEGGGKVSGTMFFDQGRGMVVADTSTTETESTVAVTGQQNMTIPISQKSTSIQTLLP